MDDNKVINIHLVSDSTAETVQVIKETVVSQFPSIKQQTFIWPVVNKIARVTPVLKHLKTHPGIVLYTILDAKLAQYFISECKKINSCFLVPGVDYVLMKFSQIFQIEPANIVGLQHTMDTSYFKRIEAINFTHEHDDGRITEDIDRAEIVLLGVSRTSKTPTSAYLAHRGFKVVNIPFISEDSMPNLEKLKKNTIIVALTIDPLRLYNIRKARVSYVSNIQNSYIDLDSIKKEIADAKKFFTKIFCPIIDVTNRSVEETAAHIIRIYQARTIQD
jgi:regulator of PEP synthase PpsR (kinase-PPPase family)